MVQFCHGSDANAVLAASDKLALDAFGLWDQSVQPLQEPPVRLQSFHIYIMNRFLSFTKATFLYYARN